MAVFRILREEPVWIKFLWFWPYVWVVVTAVDVCSHPSTRRQGASIRKCQLFCDFSADDADWIIQSQTFFDTPAQIVELPYVFLFYLISVSNDIGNLNMQRSVIITA